MTAKRFTGKTVEEATEIALHQLDVELEDIDLKVVTVGRTGIFGMGGEPAEIEVRLLSEPDDDAGLDAQAPEVQRTVRRTPRVERQRKQPARSSPRKRPSSSTRRRTGGETAVSSSADTAEMGSSDPKPNQLKSRRPRVKRTGLAPSLEKGDGASKSETPVGMDDSSDSKREEGSFAEPVVTPPDLDSTETETQSEPVSYERDAEAEQVISELLDYLLGVMNVEADAYVLDDLEEGSLVFEIEGEDSGLIIGHRGDTIRHFQFLVRMLLKEKLGRTVKFIIDVEGYRNRRLDKVREIAQNSAEKAVMSDKPVTLGPMPANERRMVHMSLADNAQVFTESKGQGRGRRVVIHPRQD